MSKFTLVFPGQGKKFGRAELELLRRHKDVSDMADDILGYSVIGKLQDDSKEIIKTEYAQPYGYLTAVLYCREYIEKTGRRPEFCIGHSLGEFSALTAARYMELEDGLKLIKKRGEIMSKASGGSMSAVMGRYPDRLMNAVKEIITEDIDIGNYNSPFQTVISGPTASVEEAGKKLTEKGLKVVPLSVSGAFHSRQMKQANEAFLKELEIFPFGKGNGVKVMSSATALVYGDEPLQMLKEQMTGPVRFTESINNIIDMDCYDFVQVDGGQSLISLIDDIKFARALAERNRK